MRKTKEPVRLRQRKMPSGVTSLYLDIYLDGRRTYEYLHLYLNEEKSRKDKEANYETLRLAEAIKAKRVIEIQNGVYGFQRNKKADMFVLDYFQQVCEEYRTTNGYGTYLCWRNTMNYLKRYCAPTTTFRAVDSDWLRGFMRFLNGCEKLSQNTRFLYNSKLRAFLHRAYNEHILTDDPLRGCENFRLEERERVYLTLAEVKAMAATPCSSNRLKRAFLFSCLTGVRRCDIEKLRWHDVSTQGEFTRIIFRQQKTRGQEYLDITPHALPYLGERKDDDQLVFDGFRLGSHHEYLLREWAHAAGVSKHVTFHSARHSFAVLMLDLGADIYTVQKLLGHRELQTTQVYAHILDKNKQAAVSLIPSFD